MISKSPAPESPEIQRQYFPVPNYITRSEGNNPSRLSESQLSHDVDFCTETSTSAYHSSRNFIIESRCLPDTGSLVTLPSIPSRRKGILVIQVFLSSHEGTPCLPDVVKMLLHARGCRRLRRLDGGVGGLRGVLDAKGVDRGWLAHDGGRCVVWKS